MTPQGLREKELALRMKRHHSDDPDRIEQKGKSAWRLTESVRKYGVVDKQ